jgi:hypothetical protein
LQLTYTLIDKSGPLGTWYLKSWYRSFPNPRRLFNITLDITQANSGSGTYSASLVNEEGNSEEIDQIRWNESYRRLVFRSHRISTESGSHLWRWFNGTIVEGILTGRFSQRDIPDEPLFGDHEYANHVTGWNSNYIDGKDIVPRVYDVFIDGDYRGIAGRQCRGLLRLDRTKKDFFIGSLKVYATGRGNPWEIEAWDPRPVTLIHETRGEELEYDLEVTQWDGTNLRFIRRDSIASWTQVYTGQVNGRTISGTFTHSTLPGQFRWNGFRAQVLTYGLVGRSTKGREIWQERTRRQLYHLMMADNPVANTKVNSGPVEPPTDIIVTIRDDNPSAHHQNYNITDIWFDYTIQNPYGGPAIVRRSHAKLAVPTTTSNSGKYPAVLAVNGHSGSAWRMFHPHPGNWFEPLYWYADSFARRGFVVLAVDISHRDDSPLYGPPCDWWAPREHFFCDQPSTPPYPGGDDPDHGNGPHPSIKMLGFDSSDWEEDGERSWDVMRALDYLLSLKYVDRKTIVYPIASILIVANVVTIGVDISAISASTDLVLPQVPMVYANISDFRASNQDCLGLDSTV